MMDDTIRVLRTKEFSRLDAGGHVYLDHTGSALYPESLVRQHADRLLSGVYGNPHSKSPSSEASTQLVEGARARVLEFFNADPAEYEAIFTLNASGGMKLLGESYPFGPGSMFRLTADNHNSVNGIREYASARGGDVRYVPLEKDLRIGEIESALAGADPTASNLFAYPAQSNFSGVKHPLDWIETAHSLGYDVLLDAAAYVPTNRLDLSAVKPEFVAISFYKMFGYPTGVGALIARREALARLRRPWFAGGTVRFVSTQNQISMLYGDAEAFEDGTLNFLDIAAIPVGLDFLDSIGMERIHAHIRELTTYLLERIQSLQHPNGAPLVRIYGPTETEGRGGTVAFNLMDPSGRVIDYEAVEVAASEVGISLRTGCFCNPGAAETSFDLPAGEALRCFRELGENFSIPRFSACLRDKPVGAVRVSLGPCNHEGDIDALCELLRRWEGGSAANAAAVVGGQAATA